MSVSSVEGQYVVLRGGGGFCFSGLWSKTRLRKDTSDRSMLNQPLCGLLFTIISNSISNHLPMCDLRAGTYPIRLLVHKFGSPLYSDRATLYLSLSACSNELDTTRRHANDTD